jgi:hypothetical protein
MVASQSNAAVWPITDYWSQVTNSRRLLRRALCEMLVDDLLSGVLTTAAAHADWQLGLDVE